MTVWKKRRWTFAIDTITPGNLPLELKSICDLLHLIITQLAGSVDWQFGCFLSVSIGLQTPRACRMWPVRTMTGA
jgi:hypothetical protein